MEVVAATKSVATTTTIRLCRWRCGVECAAVAGTSHAGVVHCEELIVCSAMAVVTFQLVTQRGPRPVHDVVEVVDSSRCCESSAMSRNSPILYTSGRQTSIQSRPQPSRHTAISRGTSLIFKMGRRLGTACLVRSRRTATIKHTDDPYARLTPRAG